MDLLKRSAMLSACLCTCASAQDEGQATWLWDVTTQDGDAIVEPGETATITLSMLMEPEQNVYGFGFALFDVIGSGEVENGAIVDWQILSFLHETYGDTTTTDGMSLFGVTAAQIVGEEFVTENPIDVISFEWSPSVFAPYEVLFMSNTANPPNRGEIGVYIGNHIEFDYDSWPVAEAEVAFVVVPAPASFLMIVGGVLLSRYALRNRGELSCD